MNINQALIDQLNKLVSEADSIQDELSKKITESKEAGKENYIEVMRDDGKLKEVKESDLWTEYFYLGDNAKNQREVLQKKYPEVFSLGNELETRMKLLETFIAENLGFRGSIRISDIVNLTFAVSDFRVKQYIEENKKSIKDKKKDKGQK